MNKELLLLINSYRKLSPSHGTAPCSVTEIEFETLSFNSNMSAKIIFKEFTNLLAIGIWQDYNQIDLTDFIKSSKEYKYLPIEQQKPFIDFRLNQLSESNILEQWKENQATLAYGLLIAAAKNEGYQVKVFENGNLDKYELSKLINLPNQRIIYLIAFS